MTRELLTQQIDQEQNKKLRTVLVEVYSSFPIKTYKSQDYELYSQDFLTNYLLRFKTP